MPCGFAAGIAGLRRKLGWGAPCDRRNQIAVSPTSSANRETTSDKAIATLPPRLAYVSENQPPLEPTSVRKVIE